MHDLPEVMYRTHTSTLMIYVTYVCGAACVMYVCGLCAQVCRYAKVFVDVRKGLQVSCSVTLDSITYKTDVSLSLELGWGPTGPKDFPSGAFTMLGL